MDLETSFGRWLRHRRRALDLTQDDLARRVGCAVVSIQKLEADERRPSRQLAERLADSLQIAADERAAIITLARAEPYRDPAPAAAAERLLRAPERPPTNLPAPLTRLIGRKQDIAAVRNTLLRGEVRLLTLLGPPGIGKTRLSIEVARDMHPAFSDGTSFVALAPIRDPALVLATIAQTLGITESTGRPLLEQLKAVLQAQRRLLVLDNFEHLLDAAPLVVELLEACEWLKALVTSRAALYVRGERLYVVPPLLLPDLTHLPAIGGLARTPAVALFVERAQAVLPDFTLTAQNAAAVAAICVRLDGLPLAIELAAARIRLLSPAALLARLEQRLAVLTDGARDLPPRQRTLRAAIGWSYELLDAGEQRLFARLGVFVGGCTLEAAAAVCHVDNDLSLSVVDGIATLVDQSLVQQQEGREGEPRFTMLETIREYALERLEASGEAEQLHRQHARYYLTLSEKAWTESGSEEGEWVRHMERDYDNLRLALAWSQTVTGDPEVALRLANALCGLWYDRGVRQEAIAALERSLNHPLGVGRTNAHAAARANLAQFLGYTGNYASARIQYEQVLPIAREVGDTWRYAGALGRLGWLAREQGDSATAWARLTESIALFRELGIAHEIAWMLTTLAEVAVLDEDPARAEALLAESRASGQREHADPNWLGWTLNHLGHAAQLRRAYDRAAQLHHESLELFQAFSDQHFGLPWAYHSLGETTLGMGRLAEAARWLAQGLALSQTLSDQASIAWCLAGLGSTAALGNQPERAARLWGAAERLRQAIGCRPAPAARATYERAVAAARAQLDEATFAAAWAEGQAMTLEQAIAYALNATSPAPPPSHPLTTI